MSSPWTVGRSVSFLGIRELGGFSLRTYAIVAPDRDKLVGDAEMAAAEVISNLAPGSLSDEFTYHRVGFLILNVGRRGVDILLYHFGAWVDTPEIFHLSWYRYNETQEYELLDRSQPIGCYVDAPLILSELGLWRSLIRAQVQVGVEFDFSRLYQLYLASGPSA